MYQHSCILVKNACISVFCGVQDKWKTSMTSRNSQVVSTIDSEQYEKMLATVIYTVVQKKRANFGRL